MSSINNVSGSNNWSWLQPTNKPSNSAKQLGGADSDGDSSSSIGSPATAGQSNFLNTIVQALEQSLSGSTGTSSAATPSTSTASTGSSAASGTTQTPAEALQAFLQNLFASLGQANGTQQSANTSTGNTSTGNSSAPAVHRHGHHHGGGDTQMAAGIESLLQQLNASSQGSASANSSDSSSSGNSGSGNTSAIGNLNSSFQNLVSSLDASQGQSATAANTPSLQTFLQNLLQNIGNTQSSTGSVISTQV